MLGGSVLAAYEIPKYSLSSYFGSQIKRLPYNNNNNNNNNNTNHKINTIHFYLSNKPARGISVLSCVTPPRNSNCVSLVSTKLFVSGLSFRTTKESLTNAFQKFGELEEVNLVMDRIANRSRGFAFLSYSTDEESKNAIEGMHGKFLDGRVIFVEVAKSKAELRQDITESHGFSIDSTFSTD